jgi:hypothetical protein
MFNNIYPMKYKRHQNLFRLSLKTEKDFRTGNRHNLT